MNIAKCPHCGQTSCHARQTEVMRCKRNSTSLDRLRELSAALGLDGQTMMLVTPDAKKDIAWAVAEIDRLRAEKARDE